ncbi:hypothetical protein GYMLUDRAFT_61874 [Collybiopsis luxurians FD-317 M1]|uniref:Uncharacterized protein n=1 Tax=Collybiopsis luxurians FD-317 M1 TaxID=944289 RepID=A0A0D0CEX9_9AGAR|nr:hypothetical protein GYMLUDRAFT_61874 [Collybiopsis luxurians FD-317 M1]
MPSAVSTSLIGRSLKGRKSLPTLRATALRLSRKTNAFDVVYSDIPRANAPGNWVHVSTVDLRIINEVRNYTFIPLSPPHLLSPRNVKISLKANSFQARGDHKDARDDEGFDISPTTSSQAQNSGSRYYDWDVQPSPPSPDRYAPRTYDDSYGCEDLEGWRHIRSRSPHHRNCSKDPDTHYSERSSQTHTSPVGFPRSQSPRSHMRKDRHYAGYLDRQYDYRRDDYYDSRRRHPSRSRSPASRHYKIRPRSVYYSDDYFEASVPLSVSGSDG